METKYISTANAAKALGVSVSTVKRWVDDDILPAHKTAGGHRKLLLSDILRLGRAGQLPHLDMARLEALGSAGACRDPDQLAASAIDNMVTGDAESLRALMFSAYQSGIGIPRLLNEILAPGLDEIREREVEPGRSHRFARALQITKSAIYELKSVLELHACQKCPVAVGGAPEGDFDSLPSLMLQLTLLDGAWETINLGPHTPIESFEDAIVELSPKLLWIAFSATAPTEAFFERYDSLHKRAAERGVSVVVYGTACADSWPAEYSNVVRADHLEQVAAFAQTLHPTPRLPRRGRPAIQR